MKACKLDPIPTIIVQSYYSVAVDRIDARESKDCLVAAAIEENKC